METHGDKATDFQDKYIAKVGSNHTCLVVNSINSALKKRRKLLSRSVFNRMQIHLKRSY